MRRMFLLAVLFAVLAMVIAPLYVFGAPDELHPEHVAEFKPGDRVTVLDAAGVRHPADLIHQTTNGWWQVAIDGQTQNDEGLFVFPSANIRPATWPERLPAAFTEKTQRVKTWGITLATAIAAWLAKDAQFSSDKDTNQTEVAAAAQQAQQAAEDAIRNGAPDGARYFISGTFTGPQIIDGTGAWTPALTLATNGDGRSGSVIAATVPNKADGSSQVLEGIGSWSVLGEGRIVIRGLPPPYSGDAALSGVAPYGPVSFPGASIRLANNATLTGGTVQSATPPESQ